MRTRHDELREDVCKFHKEHPMVWELFCQFTFDRISLGFKHYSVNAVFERIRWETDQAQVGDDQFKINNNHHAFYARAFMRKYPEHDGFFRTRSQISKDTSPVCRRELRPSDYEQRV